MNNFSYSTKELDSFIGILDIPHSNNKTKIKKIGLTGASGFLGMHLIQRLVEFESIVKIKCFIRSKQTFDMRKQLFKLDFDETKLEFCFEINSESTKDLDTFIHSAAQVHNIKSLSGLYKDNVELTKTVVEEVSCPIIYISTLSIYASSNKLGTHLPLTCLPSDEHIIYGGYAQSKWIGERLIEKRLDSRVIRFGLLTPSSKKPILLDNEFFPLFLKLSKEFPYYPIGFEESFIDISPIDFAVDKLINAIFSDEKHVHIANESPTSIRNFIETLNLQPISLEEWENFLNTVKKTEKILLSYAYFKSKSLEQYPKYFNIDLFQTTGHNWIGSINVKNINQYIKSIYEKL